MSKRAPVFTVAAMAVAVLATPSPAGAVVAPDLQRPVALQSFGSCEALVRYGVRHLDRYRARGVPHQTEDTASGGGDAAMPASSTNLQEAGVDEPDIVKTDGTRIFALARGKLHAVDVAAGAPRLLGSLDLPDNAWDAQIFLQGDRVLVMWSAYHDHRDVTVLAEVDATEPAAMRILRTATIDGYLLTARMTQTTARVVLRSMPPAVALGAEARGRRRVSQWLPRAALRDRVAGTRSERRAVACRDVRRAGRFAGLGMVTVVTVDFAGGLDVTDTDTLLTDAETAYASTAGLYLATAREDTTVHAFDTAHPTETTYRGSGVVPGTLLNQFSLSEHDGVLRVASTDERESFVTTLRPDAVTGALSEVGGVSGLGPDERIYAVRFMGDIGYVVTFRETDPLYTVDLSDPARPRVVGELKIEGYSAYLHPVGDGRLLGIGQDATRQGRRLGTQVSLFDVSDLAAPTRLAHRRLGGENSFSAVEYEHRAFLWWPATGLAVVPVSRWDDDAEVPESAAFGLRVAADRIDVAGRAEHPERHWDSEVRRSLVAGGMLYTLSGRGLLASTLETLDERAWLALR